ncbi:flagellar hook-basal body family protein [Collimonas fungivorans]|jgi:flagellar basal-body rod protein FlgG|uniref:Flagellar hook-basal body family protein n=1 Tax=Collimonas fungivorans TaxID=158899 RepID=A0A127PDS0_9BURK|nr:flagellar hook-basal body protein [Collimonas fungivorans]AMO95591.1 flagellar hook-basal body family protein [Collimonas fungivorans]
MEELLGIALQSMQQDMARVDRVAMNLSNALTPAYKREVAVVRAQSSSQANSFARLLDAGMADAMARNVPENQVEVLSDIRPGTLKSTGQNLDLAIAGSGYFEVQTENGAAYTRQGNFRMDARGRLVTAQGYAVMGKGGDIYLNTSQPSIDAAGNIVENKLPVGQLKIVQFDKPASLRRLGDGLVAAGEGMAQLQDSEIQVKQGYLENANVSSMHEMVELTQTMRHFESMQKVAQGYDEMLGTAIRKLGDM